MSQSSPIPPNSSITDIDAVNILAAEWQFRQRHCWASLSRFVVVAVSIAIAPHVVDDLPKKLGDFVMVLPVTGGLVAIAAVWLFGAEYVRMHPILEKYRQLMGGYYPPKPDLGCCRNLFFVKIRIGWATFIVLLLFLSTLAFVNGFLVWRLVHPKVPQVKNEIVMSTPLLPASIAPTSGETSVEGPVVKLAEIFFLPATILVPALCVATTEPLKTGISALGFLTGVLWLVCCVAASDEVQISTIDFVFRWVLPIVVGLSWLLCLGIHGRAWCCPRK